MSQEKYRLFPVSDEALRPGDGERFCPLIETGERDCCFPSIAYGARAACVQERSESRAEAMKPIIGALLLLPVFTARAWLFRSRRNRLRENLWDFLGGTKEKNGEWDRIDSNKTSAANHRREMGSGA
jgi:hypothetical protein